MDRITTNNAKIGLVNGLGDKLLDMIGFTILCKYLNYNPHIQFINNGKQPWGVPEYDIRLFDLDNSVTIFKETNGSICDFYVKSYNPSSSLCPYSVYKYVNRFIPDITFEQISTDFVTESKKIIKPSQDILLNIPADIDRAYGIHLRKSDKVSDNCDIRHENSNAEFSIIIDKLLEDVNEIILTDPEPIFFVVSEDNSWKNEICNVIRKLSDKKNKQIKILHVDYTNKHNYFNYTSVLDMFCLSRCKEILQGVKYSTFSIVASLVGNNKLRNYAKYCNSYNICLIHLWSSCVYLNGSKNFDKSIHDALIARVAPIETNITAIFVPQNDN